MVWGLPFGRCPIGYRRKMDETEEEDGRNQRRTMDEAKGEMWRSNSRKRRAMEEPKGGASKQGREQRGDHDHQEKVRMIIADSG